MKTKNKGIQFISKIMVFVLLMLMATTNIMAANLDVDWSKKYGNEVDNFLYSIVETNDGNYIAAGDNEDDGWILKTNKSGEELWSKKYGSSNDDALFSISKTSDGGYIAAGKTSGNVGGTTNLGEGDGWIIKIDKDGNELWSKQFGSSKADYLKSIIETSEGGYIASGYTVGSVGNTTNLGFDDGWIIKVDKDGNEVFSKQYGGLKDEHLQSITATLDGNYILSGYTESDIGNSTNIGLNDGWILKIDQDGNELFSKQYINYNFDVLYSIVETKDGNYIAAGATYVVADEPTYDGWILKVDKNGKELFSNEYGNSKNDQLYSIIACKDGSFVASGYAYEEKNNPNNLGKYDGWIIKLSEEKKVIDKEDNDKETSVDTNLPETGANSPLPYILVFIASIGGLGYSVNRKN